MMANPCQDDSSKFSFGIEAGTDDSYLCEDNTGLDSKLALGPLCHGGPLINPINIEMGNKGPKKCQEVSVCGVLPTVETKTSDNNKTLYTMSYQKLPIGCIGYLSVSKNEIHNHIRIDVPLPECTPCSGTNTLTCSACAETPPSKKKCLVQELRSIQDQPIAPFEIPDGAKLNTYKTRQVVQGSDSCTAIERLCDDGVLQGDPNSIYQSCYETEPPGIPTATPSPPPSQTPTPSPSTTPQPTCSFWGSDHTSNTTFYGFKKTISNSCDTERVSLTCNSNGTISPDPQGLFPFCVKEVCANSNEGSFLEYVHFVSNPQEWGDPTLVRSPQIVVTSTLGTRPIDSGCKQIQISTLNWKAGQNGGTRESSTQCYCGPPPSKAKCVVKDFKGSDDTLTPAFILEEDQVISSYTTNQGTPANRCTPIIRRCQSDGKLSGPPAAIYMSCKEMVTVSEN